MSVRLSAGVLALCALLASGARGATPPAGFVERVVIDGTAATGAEQPTGVAYEPGTGNVWVTEKGASSSQTTARVRRKDAGLGVVTTALTLGCVDGQGERGLLGIAFSPGWLTPGGSSRQVYLYYTRRIASSGACAIAGQSAGVRNRVSRFTETGGVLSNEQVVLEGPYLTAANNHNGGTVRFGLDGTLLVSMGDNDTDANPNPLSRDRSDLRGKLLRVNPDGSIPQDNPFVGQSGIRPEIWAWGLRNPFRFSVDSENGAVWIGDVGEVTWEEIDFGVAGADYGYPCLEGPASFRACNPAPAPGSLTAPVYAYGHGSETPPVTGGAVIGGPVYRHTAFPAEYRGSYFFGDFVYGWVRRAQIGPGNQLSNVQMFLPDASSVVDLVVSPAGCLTWVGIYGAGVREVCYQGADLADADRSGRVDGRDLARLGRAFGDACGGGRYEAEVDFDHDCTVDGDDLSFLSLYFGETP